MGRRELIAECCSAELSANGITIRRLQADDVPEAARVCYEAFTTFNASVSLPPDFPPLEVANIPEALLSQGLLEGFEGFVAVNEQGAIVGSNLVELRDEVAGIGPISVSTEAAGKGVGRMLMQAVMQAAQRKGMEVVRLHQIANNTASFSLYLGCGFDPSATCGHYEGVCVASMPAGLHFATLAEEHVDACDRLHKLVCGLHRRNDILAMVSHPAPSGVVLDSQGTVVAYSTGAFLSGHSVATSFEAFQALTVGISTKIEELRAAGMPLPPCTFYVPHTYPQAMRWLAKNGFKLIRQVVQMGYGTHEQPVTGLYMPAMQY